MNKETMLILLRRRLRHLTRTQPDHVAMATAGMSYEQRAEALKKQDREADEAKKEAEALGLAISFLEEHHPS